jgi:N-acetylglucosamine-6-sulfatase
VIHEQTRIGTLCATVMVLVCFLACSPSAHRAPTRVGEPKVPPQPLSSMRRGGPNIVFVLTDDLSWNLVQFMPHVLELQKHGVTFVNYFVTDSLCCPSRASIFTGRYPHNTGIFSNRGADGGYVAFRKRGLERTTLATALSAGGFRTAMMGSF